MENEIRIGKISSVDYTAGMARVVYHDKDNAVTRPLPFLASEYAMPKVGDQVAVIHLSNGTEAGIIIGCPWSSKRKPPESGAGIYRKDFAATDGEAYLKYDATAKLLALLAAAFQVTASTITLSGNVTVSGNLTVTGTITAGGNITADGDVVAGGISLKEHTHTCSCALSSGSTSAPV